MMTSPQPDKTTSRMTSALSKPQIIPYLSRSLAYTPYDVRWVPSSARFVVIGQLPRGTGILQVCELKEGEISVVAETEKPAAFKCGTFGASSLYRRHFATGDFEGKLSVWDLECPSIPLYSTKAHSALINCIDGCGSSSNTGPPEIITGSRDGCIKVWDTRQKDKPVVTIAPAKGEAMRDCWAVAFGNSYNDEERAVAAGYDNGDVKLFDLRNMKLLWETNLKNGICSLAFDRATIRMNKLLVTTLEAQFHVFDLRTFHSEKGFAKVSEIGKDGATIWMGRHLPHNRDIWMASQGIGGLGLWKYNYPSPRSKPSSTHSSTMEGVPGTIELLQTALVAEQPVNAFDWSPDKEGLCVFTAFDQCVRVGIVTKLKGL